MPSQVAQLPINHPELVNGEMAIGPFALRGGIPAYARYFMARRFKLLPGRHSVRAVVESAASFWVGSNAIAMRNVADIQLLEINEVGPVVQFDFEVYLGEERLDIYLSNVAPTLASALVSFSLYREGQRIYSSNALDWGYQTEAEGPLADEDLLPVVDPRRNYVVFSLLPNWQTGMMERVEYLTDVITGDGALEQRRSMRPLPRRSIEASFMRTKANRARLNNFLTGLGMKPFLVPIWFEQYHLPRDIDPFDATFDFPPGTLAMREFRAGDLVLVIDKDPNNFDVCIIDTVDLFADTITWEVRPERKWLAGARLIPLQLARILETPSMSNVTDLTATVQIRFSMVKPYQGFGASWGKTSSVFPLEPNWSEPVTMGYDRNVVVLDNEMASPVVHDSSDQALIGQRASFLLRGREAVVNFRKFIEMARGRARRFRVQSFTNDVILQADVPGGNEHVDAEPALFPEATETRQFSRRQLAFYFNDGRAPLYRTVLGVEAVSPSGVPPRALADRYYFKGSLPAMSRRAIDHIAWLQFARFDQDAFEIQHEVDGLHAVRVALVFRTVDGVDDAEVLVTSRPYTLDAVDAIEAEVSFARPINTTQFADALDGSMEFVLIDVRSPLRSNAIRPEAISGSAEFVQVVVVQINFLSTEMRTEAISGSAQFVSATTKNSLVKYDRYAVEAISSTAEFVGATLT